MATKVEHVRPRSQRESIARDKRGLDEAQEAITRRQAMTLVKLPRRPKWKRWLLMAAFVVAYMAGRFGK